MKKMLVLLCSTFIISAIFATNGMNMIGYGARSSAMGGISFGLLDDANSINTNPAAISFINGKKFDLNLGLLLPSMTFKNSLNEEDADASTFPLPAISYVQGQNSCKFTFGVGFYAQGGMGATYELKHNMYRDYQNNPADYISQEYHSKIAYMKFSPTISYQVTPKFSLGLSPNIGYAMLEMKMPFSMSPAAMAGVVNPQNGMTFGDMFGAPMDQNGLGYDEVTASADMGDGVTATGFGGKFGAMFKVNENLSIGGSYTMSAGLDFEGDASMDMTSMFGDAYLRMLGGALAQMGTDMQNATPEQMEQAQTGVNTNLTNMGIDMSLGMQADFDAEIEFSWPQEIGLGAVYQNEKFLIGFDVNWINWKDSMESFKMDFNNGTNDNITKMMGSENLKMEMPMNWDDQIVIAIGGEFYATEKLALRAGYNFASNPVPAETIIPLFPAVVEHHITFGAGYQINQMLAFNFGYEYIPEVEVEVENSIIANEYDGSSSSLSENVIHMGLSLDF